MRRNGRLGLFRGAVLPAACAAILLLPAALLPSAEDARTDRPQTACKVLADKRLEQPLQAIAGEYYRRTMSQPALTFLPHAEVSALAGKKPPACDVIVCMADDTKSTTAVQSLPGARTVAWKYPTGEPVWAAALTDHPDAAAFARFLGGPTAHRLWSESEAGFTMTSGKTSAEAHQWVVENRVKHTYPLTAVRLLNECGGIRDGICIDIGCGSGLLDIELARRSNLKIIGLDIDPDARPFFEKAVREAGLQDRLSFVVGDAQKMPFPDHYADMIVSRGTLTFIPDIGKCLREVHRILKPTGVAFLGGRYLYTPQKDRISTESLRRIVAESGVPGTSVIEARGQWVKIVGPEAPEAARRPQGGPHMLAERVVADYAITEGDCLLICKGDGELEQGLQQGLLGATNLKITALYPSKEAADQAEKKIRGAAHAGRIECKVGSLAALPFADSSFDLVAGVGPVLIWEKDKAQAMREVYRVLRSGGAALLGGEYRSMPDFRKVSSDSLRESAAATGIPSIRVIDDMGQWVEVRKGIKDRGFCD